MNAEGKPEYREHLEQIHSFKPEASEYLVQMLYAPVNPSDFYFLNNLFPFKKPVNSVTGIDGTGRIVEVGEGEDKILIGKIVNIYMTKPSVYGTLQRSTWSTRTQSLWLTTQMIVSSRETHFY